MGGWDGNSGSTSTDAFAPSTLDDQLQFLNWIGSISISNLVIDGATGGRSLEVTTDGDINVDNVSVINGSGVGLYLDNCQYSSGACTTSGMVTV